MTMPVRCDNTEEHDGHWIEAERTKHCSGKTDCGQWSHPAHDYEYKATFYCVGVCICGFRHHSHGPGEHK